jgi:hypothetical protein
VTAQDGSIIKNYAVVVTRMAAPTLIGPGVH